MTGEKKLAARSIPVLPAEEGESRMKVSVEVRDARQALTPKEVEAKEKLLSLMKAHEKITYRHGGIEITRIVEKEKVRVRIHKEKDED